MWTVIKKNCWLYVYIEIVFERNVLKLKLAVCELLSFHCFGFLDFHFMIKKRGLSPHTGYPYYLVTDNKYGRPEYCKNRYLNRGKLLVVLTSEWMHRVCLNVIRMWENFIVLFWWKIISLQMRNHYKNVVDNLVW